MKNKMLLGVAALFTLSSLAFGTTNSTESDEVTVNITIVKPISLELTNSSEISFGSVPQQSNTEEILALNTVDMKVTGADNGTQIVFYINEEGEENSDATLGEDLVLNKGTDNITATLKLSSILETVAEGVATSTISASIAPTNIKVDTPLGDYSNTVTVSAEYN